jgi:hypothetical protein
VSEAGIRIGVGGLDSIFFRPGVGMIERLAASRSART